MLHCTCCNQKSSAISLEKNSVNISLFKTSVMPTYAILALVIKTDCNEHSMTYISYVLFSWKRHGCCRCFITNNNNNDSCTNFDYWHRSRGIQDAVSAPCVLRGVLLCFWCMSICVLLASVYCIFLLLFNFCFLSTSQEIGWKEHLQSDPFCVEWDVKPYLSQCSVPSIWSRWTGCSGWFLWLMAVLQVRFGALIVFAG